MKTRRLLGDLLIAVTVAFTVYLAVVMIHRIHTVVLKEIYVRAFRDELLACAFFILFALDLRFGFFTGMKSRVLRAVGWLLRVAAVLMVIVLLFFIGKVTVGSLVRSDEAADNVLVLGMALENGKPTEDLLCRLDTAEKYLQKNPDATLILTGGNADASGKTEADVMHDILTERGVAEEKLRLEDRAKSTKENFRNTAQMIDPEKPIAVISSNYHMARAVRMAEEAGFTRVLRQPAPSSPLYFGANVMWEVIMELNDLTQIV